MTTTKFRTKSDNQNSRRTWLNLAILVGVILISGGVWLYASWPPPQLGTSDAVFQSVDALFTAVRNEDMAQLDRCEQRLRAEFESGDLPPTAWRSLEPIISTARAGRWRPAAKSLYAFMLGQRRDR